MNVGNLKKILKDIPDCVEIVVWTEVESDEDGIMDMEALSIKEIRSSSPNQTPAVHIVIG
jgi:hypothetical protein